MGTLAGPEYIGIVFILSPLIAVFHCLEATYLFQVRALLRLSIDLLWPELDSICCLLEEDAGALCCVWLP